MKQAAGVTADSEAGQGYARLGFEGGAMLFDRARLAPPGPQWLQPQHYGGQARAVQAGGRQAAWFVQGPGWQAVLRGYRRGGWVARLSRQRYIWTGEAGTRAFREFRLLARLHAQGLPVPQPLAAACWRHGLTYEAAILIERINGARALAQDLTPAACEAAGQAIASMHRAGVWHADLNAFNILLDPPGRAWLIDFDRGHARGVSLRQRQANLQRLRRSLRKVAGEQGEAAWQRIHQAYQAAGA